MVKTVVSVELPVEECLRIQKNRIEPQRMTGKEKRMVIVTGTHGDELEGQYVCYELNRLLREMPQHLKGIVDIFPAFNPLGIDSVTRGIPMFDLDMNRIFPGNPQGPMAEHIAASLVEDLAGSDVCVDIHASNIYIREIPQVRMNESTSEHLLPYAKLLNTDFIWVHSSAKVLEATLAHSLNTIGTPTLVVEMGVGMRITKEFTSQLIRGILRLMKELGIWDGPVEEVRTPVVSRDGKVGFVNAKASGIFIPCARFWEPIREGAHLGDIISPLTGEVLEKVLSPISGMIFTLREYPVVYEGALLARVLGGEEE